MHSTGTLSCFCNPCSAHITVRLVKSHGCSCCVLHAWYEVAVVMLDELLIVAVGKGIIVIRSKTISSSMTRACSLHDMLADYAFCENIVAWLTTWLVVTLSQPLMHAQRQFSHAR